VITSAGAFQAGMTVVASGQRSATYRKAFEASSAGISNPALFGTFLQGRQLQFAPAVTETLAPQSTFQVKLAVYQDNFLLPIQRQQLFQLDLLPLVSASSPGLAREEIILAIPAGFALKAESRFSRETSFARYQSEVKVESGKLIVTREFEIKHEIPLGDSEFEALRKVARDDQQHRFLLRRIVRIDAAEWIRSVPTAHAYSYGVRAYEQHEYEAARQLLQRAVEASPNHPFAWNNLGRALSALGKLEDAKKAYEKQIAVNPADPYAYNNLGLIEERLGHWDKAIQSLQKQLEVHPGDSYAIANLPRALIHNARWAEAEVSSSKALELHPDNTQQKINLAVARVCQGKAIDARQEIDAAIGPRPVASTLNNAAYYLIDCANQLDLAVKYASRALEMATTSAAAARKQTISAAVNAQVALGRYLDTYGWVLFKQGKLEQAIDLLAAGVALSPRGEPCAHLAEAELKAGNTERAAQFWSEAIYLEPGLLDQVPPSIAAMLPSTPRLSSDREWHPLTLSAEIALPADQPSYFFALVNVDGSVQSVRELNKDDEAAKNVLPSIQTIAFPVIKIEDHPISAVYLIRVMSGGDGKVAIARSVGTEAMAIASDLAPGEFPLPVPAVAPVPTISSAGTNANYVGGGVSQPRINQKIEPQYSEEARRAALGGTVRLKCVIGGDGKPRDFTILQSLGMGLDENAILAASGWVFQPGAKDGKPVNVYATLEVNFRMAGNWHTSKVDFHLPAGAARPILEKGGSVHATGDAARALATLSFDINEHGSPINLHVDNTSDDGWGHDVSSAVRQWKFTPAHKDGEPISISCTIDFVRGT
jgi:TonB family protein